MNQSLSQSRIERPKGTNFGLAGICCAVGLLVTSCEKPVPVDSKEFSSGKINSSLVHHKISFLGELEFKKDESYNYWYQPPPLIMSTGKSVIVIPQAGYMRHHTEIQYGLTVPWENDSKLTYTFNYGAKFENGEHHFIAKYMGINNAGQPELKNIEILSQ